MSITKFPWKELNVYSIGGDDGDSYAYIQIKPYRSKTYKTATKEDKNLMRLAPELLDAVKRLLEITDSMNGNGYLTDSEFVITENIKRLIKEIK